MLQQQTLRQSVSYSGIGLHSGNKVNLNVLPAPPNTGLRFRRVDLEGSPEIEALTDHVSDTTRSTTLSKGNIKIHTVEHLIAGLAGCGVTNAILELDANEPPIADGSSRVFTKLVQDAGVEGQDEKVEPLVIKEPLELVLDETVMTVFPYDGFKITCTSSDKKGRFTQYFSTDITPETWVRELSAARTFCFFEELEYLFNKGLIRGGSLENAIVLREDAILTNEPMRYPEELVRHKILDIVGDLALMGRPLRGHIVAVKPSHTANSEFARMILNQERKAQRAIETFSPPPQPMTTPKPTAVAPAGNPGDPNDIGNIAADGCTLDVTRIMKLLPHRYPFLMVDKITKIEGNRIIGVKNVTMNEPYFQGHFPGHPIMPGVLQLEAMAQVGGILVLRLAENKGKLAYFMSAESVKWRKPVKPGDVLEIEIEQTKSRGRIGKAKGICRVGGEVVSEAVVTFTLVDA